MKWVECLRCRHRWDEDNEEHEVCACLDETGSRKVVELPVLDLLLIENTSSSRDIHREAKAFHAMCEDDSKNEPPDFDVDDGFGA